MAEAAQKIEWKKKTILSIASIADYITEKGFPETSKKYADRLYEFGESLLVFPEKYPLCRFPKLAIRMLRCAVFEKNHVFIYKTIKSKLVIYNVVHTRTLK
jgi:plasmid stabilization system protein ParE